MENPFKNVPTPVLIAGGGAVIGLGYVALKSRGESASGEPIPAEDENLYPATPVADYGDVSTQSYVPSGVAYVSGAGGGEDASSTVGAVGQTALDSVLGLATAAIGALGQQAGTATETAGAVATRPELSPELLAAIRPAAPTVITMPAPQPPPPARPATPVAAAKPDALRAGYSRFPMPVKYKKTFPGAIGWARVASGGAGSKHWIDYHIQFPKGKIQRWRYYPNVSGGRWTKIWAN